MLKPLLITVFVTISLACQTTLSGPQQTLSAGNLAKEYGRSKADVRSKYDGKEITIRGYVITKAAMPAADHLEGMVTLDETDDGSAKILCRFTGKEAAGFSKIKGDQYVTVKGIFNGELGTELRFCKLVEVE
jgi:hypothetical protein